MTNINSLGGPTPSSPVLQTTPVLQLTPAQYSQKVENSKATSFYAIDSDLNSGNTSSKINGIAFEQVLNTANMTTEESSHTPEHHIYVISNEDDEKDKRLHPISEMIQSNKNSNNVSRRNSRDSSILDSTRGSVEGNKEEMFFKRSRKDEKPTKSLCEKVTSSAFDFSSGLAKLALIPLGIGISLIDTGLLALTTCVTTPFFCSFKKGREKTSELAESTSFQFRLTKVGLTNFADLVLFKAPVYIEKNFCPDTYADFSGVLIKTDGPIKKLQKAFYNKADQACCILPKNTRNKRSGHQVEKMKNRAYWTLFVSKLVFAQEFNKEQISSHAPTNTYNFKIEKTRMKVRIESAIEDSIENILQNLIELEVDPVGYLVMQIKNLGGLLVSFNVATEENETSKERESFAKFANALALRCRVEDIDPIMKISKHQDQFSLKPHTLRYIHQFINFFMMACFEMDRSQKTPPPDWKNKIEAVCVAFDSHVFGLELSEELLGKSLSAIKSKEVFNIVYTKMKKHSGTLLNGFTKFDQQGKPIQVYKVGLPRKKINEILLDHSLDVPDFESA
jgi:hypothetical protein